MGKDKVIGLFCFDGPLYKDKNGIYCNVTLTDEMFSRYFFVVDFLYIVVRTFNSDKTYEELNMKPLTINNIEIIEVNNLNSIKGLLFTKKEFEKNINSIVERTDLIFARMPSIVSNSIIRIAKSMKKAYLVEVGGCAWDSYWNHGLKGKIIAPLMFYEEKNNVKDASYAIYVTKYFLQKRYPNNQIIENCSNVYINIQDKKVLEDRLKKIDKTDYKKIVIGQAVNSIDVKYKGEHLVLYAMKMLLKKGYDIEFQVAGPGNGDFLIKTAKKLKIENKLKLIGTLKKEELIEWLKSIDLYAQPSKQEGLPRSVIEAMSVGCPAIGSNIAGIPELLDKDCLFNPNNFYQIAEVLENILDNNKLKIEAKRNFEKSREYDIKFIEEKRKKVFSIYKENVMKNKKKKDC